MDSKILGRMTLRKLTKRLLGGLTVAYLVKDSLNADTDPGVLSILFKALTALRALVELRRKKYARACMLSLFLFKVKVGERGNSQTVYQMLTDYVRYGWIGGTYNLPPDMRSNGASTAILKYSIWERHKVSREVASKVGPIYAQRGFNRMFVFVSDTKMVEQVMLDKEAFPSRGETGITDLVGKGLLGAPSGEMHTQHRRIVGSFFSNKWLSHYADVIETETQVLVDKWKKLCAENTPTGDAEKTNITYDLSMVTLQVIMHACVGNSGAEDGGNQQFIPEKDNHEQHALDSALKEVTIATALPFMKYLPSPAHRHKNGSYAAMWKRAIGRAKEIALNPNSPMMIHTALRDARNKDGSEALTEEEVLDELNTVRAAGHETTSNTLAWAMLLLVQHPEVAVKLREEVDAVVQGTTVTFEESKQLPYTHMIIWETLRLYPTVPSFPREAAQDVEIAGYDVPKGSLVFVCQSPMNRNPAIWPNPDKFDPDRFQKLPELKPSKPVGVPDGEKFGFIPFGAGNRTCIGQRLAMLEAAQILACVAKNFTWEIADPKARINEVVDITLGPKDGLFMKFKSRGDTTIQA
mmetsp:Transcript_3875/g.4466  ORF Transcript_3875/g.4466 Transcript_3875/m.4466 type:complete len:580 (+) Transcript_3875:159-1898(+)